MAEPVSIEKRGGQMRVVMDDNSEYIGVPTGYGIWLVSAAQRTNVIVPPDPGGDRFSFPFDNGLIKPGNGYETSSRPNHQGVDYTGGAASAGNSIVSAGAGKVRNNPNAYHSGWGYHVQIEHALPNGQTVLTLYAHMIEGSPAVSQGQEIGKGVHLGEVGNTGNSFGAHLHFETWNTVEFGSHRDPLGALPEWNAL
jgi:murein DD-endopeptidase MepM/ murein hydrolase activator NlpD